MNHKRLVWQVILLLLLSVVSVEATRTTLTHTMLTTTGVSQQALASNIDRNYLTIQNTHTANQIFCKFGVSAVVNEGIRLEVAPNTNSVVVWSDKVPTAALNCLADGTATGVLTITEGIGP